ncbi:hypothetical protein V2J09_023587 [Rumex salicifolius]
MELKRMAKDQVTTVKDAVHKLQLALLEGIKDQNLLYAAGSLMSKGDYQDVVTERTIVNMCGYPLCGSSLPSERPWKGRYRIALKEHKVYDLQETYMYCSTNCIVNSSTYSASLPAERCSEFNMPRINEVLSLFKSQSLDLVEEEAMGKEKDMGFSKLKIQEKTETKGGEVSLEDWIGPSNAIEGYVPKRDHNAKFSRSKVNMKGKIETLSSEYSDAKLNVSDGVATIDRDFESAIITGDVFAGGLKTLPVRSGETFELLPCETSQKSKCFPGKKEYNKTEDKYAGSGKPLQNRDSCGNLQLNKSKQGHKPKKSTQKKETDTNFFNMDFMSTIITEDEYSVSKPLSGNDFGETSKEPNGKLIQKEAGDISSAVDKSSTSTQIGSKKKLINSATVNSDQSGEGPEGSSNIAAINPVTLHPGEAIKPSKTMSRSSLKSSNLIKSGRKVTWADENQTVSDAGNLCEFEEPSSSKEVSVKSSSAEAGENDSQRFASANAVAIALSQAAEAVASGQSDVDDAVSEAGIVVLAQPNFTENKGIGEVDDAESKQAPLKGTKISDISSTDVFDSDDSWFDTPPEGFSLTLSPFATMWNALFTWMTCSSLAYIYGKDDSLREEYLICNGREYPRKIFLPDGRSSEIKQTMDGCLARALPGLIADLKLATSLSTLEQGLARLLETMSFMDALPPFRHKQWEVISLLFLEALSIHRIPGLAPQLTKKRSFIPKVLDGAKMSIEEYDLLKDILLPLSKEA